MHLNAWVVKEVSRLLNKLLILLILKEYRFIRSERTAYTSEYKNGFRKGLTIIGSSRSGLKDFEKLLNCIVNILKFLIN